MKKYMIEYTAWTIGDRDYGFPYRTTKIGECRDTMLRRLKEITIKVNIYTGYEPPQWFELDVEEVPIKDVLWELDGIEKSKDNGSGI